MSITTNNALLEQRQEAIRQRAQQIWENRQQTGEAGDALSDWLQAEVELKEAG